MGKLAGKLIGFLIFGLMFVCVLAAVLAVSTGLVDVDAVFPNVPRPSIGAGENLPGVEVGELPGVPTFNLPGPDDLDLPDGVISGEQVVLAGRVSRRPLMQRIPAPQQLSRDPRVVGTNAFYAILMALIFGATSTLLNNMLRDEEPRIRAWLRALGIERLIGWVGGTFRWALGRSVQRGCLTLPLVALIFALYGIIFAFLERGTAILSRDGAFLAVMMAFSVGLISFGGDVARRMAGRIWHRDSHFHLYPVNLLIAAVSVAFTRLLHLSPGIAFGTPGGADVELPGDEAKAARREGLLGTLELAIVAILAGLGWAISGAVLGALAIPVAAQAADVLSRVFTAAQNTGLAVFFVGMETLFFELLPLAYGTGRSILRWSKPVWVVLFVPIAFLFNHALLNPQSGFLDSFLVSNVRFLWFVLFVLVAITAGLWFYFNVLDDALQEWAGVRSRAD